MNLTPLSRAVFATFAALIAVGCDSSDRLPSAEPPAVPPALALRAIAAGNETEQLYALELEQPGTLIVGSYRVAVHYDSTRLEFVRVSVPDSMLTAANDVGGRVLIAGAAAAGFGGGPWVTLVFRPRSATPASLPSLELLEVADVQGKDLRPALTRDAGHASVLR